jgi:hypothetical protein
MIVAWHEVPGTAPPQKSRPIGYGMIRAGVLHRFEYWREKISNAVSLSRIIGHGRWRIQRRYLAGMLHYSEQQLEHHRTQNLSRRVFGLPKETRRTIRREIPVG